MSLCQIENRLLHQFRLIYENDLKHRLVLWVKISTNIFIHFFVKCVLSDRLHAKQFKNALFKRRLNQ